MVLAVSAVGIDVTKASDYIIPEPFNQIADIISEDPLQVPVDGNDVELIVDGWRFFDSLLEDIAGAEECINLECYKLLDDPTGRLVRDAVIAKAREGVVVRLVVENITHPFTPKSFFDAMTDAGVQVRYATDTNLPLTTFVKNFNNREHRKTVIIDDKIVSTGGMNLSVKYLHDWADVHLRITGPVAANYAGLFYQYWESLGGNDVPESVEVPPVAGNVMVQAVNGGPGRSYLPDGIIKALDTAQDYIWLETGYFSPEKDLLEAMGRAAARGVDVRLMLSERVDIRLADFINEYYYEKALEMGVRVYLFKPCFNHSKTIVCDDEFCAAGSANLVIRSMHINYENCAFIYGRDFTLQMKQMHLDREKDCREITLEDTANWSMWRRLLQRIVNLIHPLL